MYIRIAFTGVLSISSTLFVCLINLFDNSLFQWDKRKSKCTLDLHFLMAKYIQHFSYFYWSFYTSSFDKGLLDHLSIYWLNNFDSVVKIFELLIYSGYLFSIWSIAGMFSLSLYCFFFSWMFKWSKVFRKAGTW